MSSKKNTYGVPTKKHTQLMMHVPELIVNIDLAHHLAANYPPEGSEEHKKEIKAVILAYENPKNTKEYQDIVDHSIKAPFQSFCKDVGIAFPKDLIKASMKDSKHYILTLKYHFNRPRPYQSASRLNIPFSKGESFSSGTPAYPSGHAAQGRMISTILTRLYPKYSGDFNIIADSIDKTRLDLGVHYPSDIEAGKNLGKHLGLVCKILDSHRIVESTLTDPAEANIKTRIGLRMTLPPELNVTDAIDAIKAIRDVSTARQFGAQEVSPVSGIASVNLYVTVVGGQLSPEVLHKKIVSLDDILSVYIKNVDGEKYSKAPQRKSQMNKKATNEKLVHNLITTLLHEELTKTDKKEIERISKKAAKKEIDAAMKSFKKSELEKEITKILGSKASKEEAAKITKAVIKRLYRELAINYPAIIDRIKV